MNFNNSGRRSTWFWHEHTYCLYAWGILIQCGCFRCYYCCYERIFALSLLVFLHFLSLSLFSQVHILVSIGIFGVRESQDYARRCEMMWWIRGKKWKSLYLHIRNVHTHTSNYPNALAHYFCVFVHFTIEILNCLRIVFFLYSSHTNSHIQICSSQNKYAPAKLHPMADSFVGCV